MANINIQILHTGSVVVDEALPFHHKGDSPIAWTGLFRGKQHQMTLPVSVYLIEHPLGRVLIDTGWHTDNRDHQLRNLSFQYPVNKAILPEGTAIHEQLARRGISPRDLDLVLMSHLHCDHADGLRLVKDAPKILVSQEEWDSANHDKIKYLAHEWKGVPIETFTLEETGEGPFGRSWDVFGDGSLEMIWIPGHSDGLCATRITNTDTGKYVLLAADAGYAEKSWKENLTPGVVNNRVQAQKSLDWVKAISQDPNCMRVIANHDPGIKPGHILL